MAFPTRTPTVATILDQEPAPVDVQDFCRHVLNLVNRSAAAVEALSGASAGSTDASAVDQALAASKVIKASSGSLKSLSIYNSGPAQFILILNSATLTADGAVTLLYPPIPIAAASVVMLEFARPLVASTGIVVCNSSTAPAKLIGSADCMFQAQYN